MTTTRRTRAARPLGAVALLAAAVVVSACGGGANAAVDDIGDADAAAAAQAGLDNAAGAPDGEYADEAWIAAAVDALYAREAFTYEAEITSEASDGEVILRTNGIVRPGDSASVHNQEIEGSRSTYVTIGSDAWVDYGDGQYRPQDEPDVSGEYVRQMWDEWLGSFADDFVIVGDETMHGRDTVHVALDPYVIDTKVEMFGEEYRNWTVELWLAAEDGHLVRAVYGGPTAPISYSVPRFTLDIPTVDCECPVHEPR